MRPHDEPYGLCYVDPITLTGLALGGAAGLAGSMFGGGGSAPASPAAPPPQAPPQQSPQQKSMPKQQQPSFIGSAATPPIQSGGKTLLGQ